MDLIRNGIRASVVIFLIYSMFFAVKVSIEKVTDCGIVQSKSSDDIRIKRGYETKLYLNIQLQKKGFKSVEVSRETYFQSKVGENVCFDFESDSVRTFTWTIGIMCVGITALFLVVCGIGYLLPD